MGCFQGILERDAKIIAGAEARRVCLGFFRQRVGPVGASELGLRRLLPNFPILKLMEPGIGVRHFRAGPGGCPGDK